MVLPIMISSAWCKNWCGSMEAIASSSTLGFIIVFLGKPFTYQAYIQVGTRDDDQGNDQFFSFFPKIWTAAADAVVE